MKFLLVWLINNILLVVCFLNIYFGSIITFIPFVIDTSFALNYLIKNKVKKKIWFINKGKVKVVALIKLKAYIDKLEKTIISINEQKSEHLDIVIILDSKPNEKYNWKKKSITLDYFYNDNVEVFSGFIGGVNITCAEKRINDVIQNEVNGYILFVDQGVVLQKGVIDRMVSILNTMDDVLCVVPTDTLNWRSKGDGCSIVSTKITPKKYKTFQDVNARVALDNGLSIYELFTPSRTLLTIYLLFKFNCYWVLLLSLIQALASIKHCDNLMDFVRSQLLYIKYLEKLWWDDV